MSDTLELPDPNKDHDIVVHPLDGDRVRLLCSCAWSYEGNKPFVDALKNRHYGRNGLAKLT